jgi:hypothetical protein
MTIADEDTTTTDLAALTSEGDQEMEPRALAGGVEVLRE